MARSCSEWLLPALRAKRADPEFKARHDANVAAANRAYHERRRASENPLGLSSKTVARLGLTMDEYQEWGRLMAQGHASAEAAALVIQARRSRQEEAA